MNLYPRDKRINPMNDHNCFGCGSQNAFGLHLEMYALADDTGVWAPFVPSERYEGYHGVIHGGIISTLLDEIMAWSLYAREIWAVTARMQTNFRKPVVVGEELVLVGSVERERGRLFEVRGELKRTSDHQILADATATFMRVPEAQAKAWTERYLSQEPKS